MKDIWKAIEATEEGSGSRAGLAELTYGRSESFHRRPQLKPATNVKELADQLTPIVRASMSPGMALATRPVLWAVVRIVVWVAVAAFAPTILPLIQFLLAAVGPLLRDDFKEWIVGMSEVLAEHVHAPDAVHRNVFNAMLDGDLPKAPAPWKDPDRAGELAASFNRIARFHPNNLPNQLQ
jgi:hypothetical protein